MERKRRTRLRILRERAEPVFVNIEKDIGNIHSHLVEEAEDAITR